MSNRDGEAWIRRRAGPRLVVVAAAVLGATVMLARAGEYQPASPASASVAAEFASELARRSPWFEGVPLRHYELRDVNWDGQYEVLERRWAFENAPGFLGGAIGHAMSWTDVYRKKSGKYELATKEFGLFLVRRRLEYRHWIRALETNTAIAPNERAVVEHNRKKFSAEFKSYVERIDAFLAERGPLIDLRKKQ